MMRSGSSSLLSSRLRFPCAALLVALLAACSSPATRVVLLPQADGSASAVVVRAKDGEEVLSQPYQRATARKGASGAVSYTHLTLPTKA